MLISRFQYFTIASKNVYLSKILLQYDKTSTNPLTSATYMHPYLRKAQKYFIFSPTTQLMRRKYESISQSQIFWYKCSCSETYSKVCFLIIRWENHWQIDICSPESFYILQVKPFNFSGVIINLLSVFSLKYFLIALYTRCMQS